MPSVIELQDLAVATSDDCRRFRQLQDQRMAHSMDTRSGAPVRNDIASVNGLAPSRMDADAWATALFVTGASTGMALAQCVGLEALLRVGTAT